METLLAFQRCLERLQFSKATKVLKCAFQDAEDEDNSFRKSVSYLFAPLLMLTACESIYYNLSFIKSRLMQDKLLDLYARVLSDLNQVTAVLDTVARYSINNAEVIQAQFLVNLIKHLRNLIIIRRRLVNIIFEIESQGNDSGNQSGHAPSSSELLSVMPLINALDLLIQQLDTNSDHPLISQMRDNVLAEMSLLRVLLVTQYHISHNTTDVKTAIYYFYVASSIFQTYQHKFNFTEDTSHHDINTTTSTSSSSSADHVSTTQSQAHPHTQSSFLFNPPAALKKLKLFRFLFAFQARISSKLFFYYRYPLMNVMNNPFFEESINTPEDTNSTTSSTTPPTTPISDIHHSLNYYAKMQDFVDSNKKLNPNSDSCVYLVYYNPKLSSKRDDIQISYNLSDTTNTSNSTNTSPTTTHLTASTTSSKQQQEPEAYLVLSYPSVCDCYSLCNSSS
eukprot:TRINITY_DN4586_c0_g1_i3.p1 TRINITY_DN4586_c0_g1~~TRINITY_DN4586_c0_g1_i3.p1  ORF type:complete len:450 (+),score=100.67 TRINITY_DN4586_c0_g1_i3:62-1411(+)